ncbi:hypothetical protein A3D00_04660 [Candidatus Woesebacteria bacterium RIFCSPHIGHO2_02_FULL_38_9]|uniref:Polymerase nucleotidyl transferase domain-containing protein n=1 Tax=Candidatus Woesebacteria bacterium RIFCSPHIGHO2_01_FULL_39_28 TaxID=1802496 RepID=A0A1F7YKZ2_9BACT|nr:MAG: hypothetical protein A2627_00490 [Candidatus Woesebacteria bacterium RIFCSPHIGHO2_01_FULL_39_28]OGM31918.1 MAG: hypothetical protein A3D00_04660 [Candidatus Woesebacteria bacterium RIFCSPHIGHO2_02_FULL_38_9]OGM56710.1 MAG: hypothetical protein A3A50_05130 [Candidatus Woesebacteria bacterium RIFCSPLOWO2_01_FULL_38_20]
MELLRRAINREPRKILYEKFIASVIYHDLFNYPMTSEELIKWIAGRKIINLRTNSTNVIFNNGLYFLQGRDENVLRRRLNENSSGKKFLLARKSALILGLIPAVRMVAVTGSLSMNNARTESDIDLMIITRKGTLWTTRLIAYFILLLAKIKVRKAKKKSDEKDRLCLNIWMDESNLKLSEPSRNIYTAHELAQTRPIISKDFMYEKLISANRWITDYWPNAVKISHQPSAISHQKKFILSYIPQVIESFARILQIWYMRKKITREIITPTRAFFHPFDWGELILNKLKTTS